MDKFEYYKDAFRNYTKFSGRATRAQYWYFVLFNLIAGFVLGIFDKMIFGQDTSVLGGLYGLIIFLPGLAVSVRRLHDIGKSGWWFLISFVPLAGFVVLLYFMASPSEEGDNMYGPRSKPTSTSEPTKTKIKKV